MISVSNLVKNYKDACVVDIPSLSIAPRERFGLVGNNGAGKTTLFRMMLDLVRPSAGEVLIDGKNVLGDDGWKRYVGSYLDENFLIDYLTPDEFFEFVGRLHGYSKEDLRLFLERFQEFFNGEITGKTKYIRDLSKGNLKKVGIAAAFIGNPRVVILDEPFESLDPTSQIRLKNILLREAEAHQITYLLSSHDLNHVTDVCNRIVLLEKGKVLKDMKDDANMLQQLEAYFTA
ncbi:MAG: ABC transporter ATP-binding protein [Bacteroidota bacterium]